MLTLAEAIRTKRLAEFIAEQEANGIREADPAAFDRLIEAAVKPPQSKGQTSRSPSRGGSTGT